MQECWRCEALACTAPPAQQSLTPQLSCPCRAPSRSVLKTASRTNLLGRRHSDGEEEEEEPQEGEPQEGSRLLSQRSDASNMASSIRATADSDFREEHEHRHFFR